MTRKSTIPATALPRWRIRHNRMGLWYVLPALVFFALMTAYPIARSLYLSFFDYSVLQPESAEFVGMGNYSRLIEEPQNRLAFTNTLEFTFLFVPPFVLLGLGIAMLLNRLRRGSVLMRTVIFTPIVVSMAVSAVMWTLFYDASFGMAHTILKALCGMVNSIAGWFGAADIITAPPEGVLGNPDWAMAAIVVTCLWNGVGFNVILYLVGLQRIDDDLYEAAEIDGAGAFQKFWNVTLPQLRPTTFLVVLLSLINALKVFGQPFIMTQGGPQDSTLTFVLRLYNLAFQYGRFELGYASAMAYALAVFIFIISLFIRRLNRPVE